MKYSKIGEVIFSATTDENVSYENEVTERPVENLGYLSDHVKQKPVKFTVSGVVAGEDAYPKLIKLREYLKGKASLIYFGRNVFYNVVIESLSTTHGKEIRNGFSFQMSCKIIKQAEKREVVLDLKMQSQISRTKKQGKITAKPKKVSKNTKKKVEKKKKFKFKKNGDKS